MMTLSFIWAISPWVVLLSGADRNTWQLFGHVHTSGVQTGMDYSRLNNLFPTQYDVGVDNNNYAPVSFEQIETIIRKQIKDKKL